MAPSPGRAARRIRGNRLRRQPTRRESRTAAAAQRDTSGMRPYARVITPDVTTDEGLFDVHRKGEDVFYEIPDEVLGEELLLVTSIARTASDIGYGGQRANTQVVRWVREGDRVLLRTVQHEVVADSADPIFRAIEAAHFEPIIQAFDIAAITPDSAGVVTEVSDLFTTDVRVLGLSNGAREQFQVRRLDTERRT